MCNFQLNSDVRVLKLGQNIPEANAVCLVILNAPKTLEITSELQHRIHKAHIDQYFTIGNKISIMYFGKILKFEIKSIESNTESSEDYLEEQFTNLSLDKQNLFFKTTEKTSWKLFR